MSKTVHVNPARVVGPWSWRGIRAAMATDKKSLNKAPQFVLARRMGGW